VRIKIVYEDAWLLVVDKPAGLLTIPAPAGKSNTLTGILNQDLKKNNIAYRLHPCHRLDRATSGLIIYAKGKAIQKKLMQEFKQRKIKKTYLAFVQGNLINPRGEIKNKIDGRFALSRYRVLKQGSSFTVVEINPTTGRKNQIRIHFKQINHPIVGEDKFAFRKDYKLRYKRLCLHAKSLEFVHPVTKRLVRIDTDLSDDLEEFLKKHGN
jgi:23S rRNA pseudouridine1911/1915/1917 synthase